MMDYDKLLEEFRKEMNVEHLGYLLIPEDERLNLEALHHLKEKFKIFCEEQEKGNRDE